MKAMLSGLFLLNMLLVNVFFVQSYASHVSLALEKDAQTTYAFYLDQQYSLAEVIRQFPILEKAASHSEQAFNKRFAASLEQMNRQMANKTSWQQLKQQHRRHFDRALDIERMEFSQAEDYLLLVQQRATGKLDSPMLETMLIFDPEYQQHPHKELSSGHRSTYVNKEGAEAIFSLDIPQSWLAIDSKRSNTVKEFISQQGRGNERIRVLLKDVELPFGEKVTKADVNDLLNPSDMQDLLPKKATYIKSGLVDIELLPGFWQRFRMKETIGQQKKSVEGIAYTLFFGRKMVQLQCIVSGDEVESEQTMQQHFTQYAAVFELIAKSLFIPSLYY